MHTDVTLAVNSETASGDELRALHGWLAEQDGLRGRVKLVERDPQPGALGPVADVVLVLQPPLAALVGVLVTWIRSRHSDVDVTVIRSDGSSRVISAKHVARLSQGQLGPVIGQLVAELEAGDEERTPSDRPDVG